MELQDIIQDLHLLDQELWTLEDKYKVLSPDFYKAMMAGELEEFDGDPEFHDDFIHWLGLYENKQSLEQQYRNLLRRRHIIQQFRASTPSTA